MTASTLVTAADLIHAPRFLGSIILSRINKFSFSLLLSSKNIFKS